MIYHCSIFCYILFFNVVFYYYHWYPIVHCSSPSSSSSLSVSSSSLAAFQSSQSQNRRLLRERQQRRRHDQELVQKQQQQHHRQEGEDEQEQESFLVTDQEQAALVAGIITTPISTTSKLVGRTTRNRNYHNYKHHNFHYCLRRGGTLLKHHYLRIDSEVGMMLDIGRQSEDAVVDHHDGADTSTITNAASAPVVAKREPKNMIMMKTDDDKAINEDNDSDSNNSKIDKRIMKRQLSMPPPRFNTRAKNRMDDEDDDKIGVRHNHPQQQQQQQESSPQLPQPSASFPTVPSSSTSNLSSSPTSTLLATSSLHGVTHKNFYGPYRNIRASLDYDYHGNYSRSRQELQDAIVHKLLDGTTIHDTTNGRVCKTPTDPWIVFTAGVMGAGKSHTMKQLAFQGLFPLQSYVVVDPDEIRSNFPEYHLYAKECPKVAGELTHTEAGYVTEIVTAAALQQGHNVLVDGSLRDYAWYQGYFNSLREEYGGLLRIAILHITAPREVVFERAANRAENTGRLVPIETLEKSLEQVPISVKNLAPLADFFCELDNSQCTSSGGEVTIRTPGITWDTFRDNWAQTCGNSG